MNSYSDKFSMNTPPEVVALHRMYLYQIGVKKEEDFSFKPQDVLATPVKKGQDFSFKTEDVLATSVKKGEDFSFKTQGILATPQPPRTKPWQLSDMTNLFSPIPLDKCLVQKEWTKWSAEWFRDVGNKQFTVAFTVSTVVSLILTVAIPITAGITLAVSTVALGILLISDAGRRLKWRRLAALDIGTYTGIRLAFSLFSKTPKNQPKDKRAPILFLHGMLGHKKTGNWLLNRIKDLGPVYSLNMGTKLKSVTDRDYQKEIERCSEKVAEFAKKHFDEPITIIAHSRGGPIAFDLLANRRIPVKKVITLGSPIREKVTLESSQNKKEKAGYLDDLSREVYKVSTTQFVHIASDADSIVPTHEALPLGEELAHVEKVTYKDLGHTSYLYSDRVVDKIRHSIANPQIKTVA